MTELTDVLAKLAESCSQERQLLLECIFSDGPNLNQALYLGGRSLCGAGQGRARGCCAGLREVVHGVDAKIGSRQGNEAQEQVYNAQGWRTTEPQK